MNLNRNFTRFLLSELAIRPDVCQGNSKTALWCFVSGSFANKYTETKTRSQSSTGNTVK